MLLFGSPLNATSNFLQSIADPVHCELCPFSSNCMLNSISNLIIVVISVFNCLDGKSGEAEKTGLLQGSDGKKKATVLAVNNVVWGVLAGYLVFITILTVVVIVMLAL